MWTGILVVALTAPSVEYGWQAGADGQLEYIIELEDIALAALRAGKEVSSDIHPDVVRSVRRFVARAERPQPARPSVAPRNDSPPAAQYGWKPGADGQLEYYIQLNAAALDAVERGQEISGNIHPEVAGKVKRLVLRLGDQPLPRISPPPERTTGSSRPEPPAPAVPATPPPIDWGGWFTYGLNRDQPSVANPPGTFVNSPSQSSADSRWPEPAGGRAPVPTAQPGRDFSSSSSPTPGLLQPPDYRFSESPGAAGALPGGVGSRYGGTPAVLEPPPSAPALGNPAWPTTVGAGVPSESSSGIRQVGGATPPVAQAWPAVANPQTQAMNGANPGAANAGNSGWPAAITPAAPPAANAGTSLPSGSTPAQATDVNPSATTPTRPAAPAIHAGRPEEPVASREPEPAAQGRSHSTNRTVWNEEPVARRSDVPPQEQVPARAVWNVVNELLLFASLGINVVAIIIARQYYLRYCMLIKEMRRQPPEVVK